MSCFYPEGYAPSIDKELLSTPALISEAIRTGKMLQGRAYCCDQNHDLYVDFGCITGRIPYLETALGIPEGKTRDVAVISRVGKFIYCIATGTETDSLGHTRLILSRLALQNRCREQYLDRLTPGDIIPAKITHLESFGAFADIGCGIVSLLPIDSISVSRISHPKDRFYVGQNIRAVVANTADGRICLSHKELLGTWEQNAANFEVGQTVSGTIRSIEPYGVFIELAPNLAGLAEYHEDLKVGMQASVFIKAIIPEKMKVKLVLIDACLPSEPSHTPLTYYMTAGHIDRFLYTPRACHRKLETVFDKGDAL